MTIAMTVWAALRLMVLIAETARTIVAIVIECIVTAKAMKAARMREDVAEMQSVTRWEDTLLNEDTAMMMPSQR